MNKEQELLIKERLNKKIEEYEKRNADQELQEKINYIYSLLGNGYFHHLLHYLRMVAIREKYNLEKNMLIHVFLHQISIPTMELNEKQICWKDLLGKIENESEETINYIYETLKFIEGNNTFIL